MNQSEQINELMGALAKAQGAMNHASKDSTNPHFKSKYADLAAVWQACREPLSKNGLAVAQTMDFVGDKQVLVTTLSHTSGQWMKSIIALPVQRPGPQELGSCISYCRRYALAAMVGVYQDDDDAEVAQKPYSGTASKTVKKDKPITEDEFAKLDTLLMQVDEKYIDRVVKSLGIDSIYDIPPKEYERTMRYFETVVKSMSKEESNESSAVA